MPMLIGPVPSLCGVLLGPLSVAACAPCRAPRQPWCLLFVVARRSALRSAPLVHVRQKEMGINQIFWLVLMATVDENLWLRT